MRPSDDRPDARDIERPSHGTETMSFGRGRGAGAEPANDPGPEESRPAPTGEVDAWYTEPDRATEQSTDPSWLSTKWQQWKGLDRDRRTIIVLIAVALAAVIVAVVGVASRDDQAAIELPAVESHGLDPDEAACFAYGLIEKRFDVRLGQEGFDTPDPTEVLGPLNQEIQALDELAADHPEADYRLITAFAAVADAGTALTDIDGFAPFPSLVAERADAVEAAVAACDDVAGFDVNELEPN